MALKIVEKREEVVAPIVTVTPRECGSCCNCCKIVAVKELNKLQDQWCEHCEIGKGCRIFGQEHRPSSCLEWDCIWKQGLMPEELRPDYTHVVLGGTTDDMRLMLWVDKHYPEAYKKPPMKKWLDGLVQSGFDVVVIVGDRWSVLTSQPEAIVDDLQKK